MTEKEDRKAIVPSNDQSAIEAMCGPAPVLSTEDRDAYQAMLDKIMQAMKPRDIVEALLVEEFVYQTREGLRYRKIKNEIIEIGRIKKALSRRAYEREEATRDAEFKRVLAQAIGEEHTPVPADLAARLQLENERLEFGPLSNGLRENMDAYERVDKLHGAVGRRRDQTLQTLDAYRTFQRLTASHAEPVIDAEFAETGQAPENGDPPARET